MQQHSYQNSEFRDKNWPRIRMKETEPAAPFSLVSCFFIWMHAACIIELWMDGKQLALLG
jgi:hypothetical protein